jgi:hypothetical protein
VSKGAATAVLHTAYLVRGTVCGRGRPHAAHVTPATRGARDVREELCRRAEAHGGLRAYLVRKGGWEGGGWGDGGDG